ncbi:hypothetical protein [Hydrocarboniphaga sp.]|uniref:hypothetical protein n=1 Tax=Hydrocarboniphaga sp. TaxID=2033016 RepID=UPI003D0CFB51
MSMLKLITRAEVDAVAQIRDELKLQAHLFKAEAKDHWDRAEVSWAHVMSDINAARESVDRSGVEISTAAQLLFETVRDSLQDIRKSLKH